MRLNTFSRQNTCVVETWFCTRYDTFDCRYAPKSGELNDYAFEGRPRADNQTQYTKNYHDGVFDYHTDAFGARDVVPVSAALDKGGEGQPEGWQA